MMTVGSQFFPNHLHVFPDIFSSFQEFSGIPSFPCFSHHFQIISGIFLSFPHINRCFATAKKRQALGTCQLHLHGLDGLEGREAVTAVTATLGCGELCDALEAVVLQMREHEVAEVRPG